jgi:hypothetical protein
MRPKLFIATVKLAYIGLDWISIFCPLCVKRTNVRFTCNTDIIQIMDGLESDMDF